MSPLRVLIALVLVGCGSSEPAPQHHAVTAKEVQAPPVAPDHGVAPHHGQQAGDAEGPDAFVGRALEVHAGGGYTYVRMHTANKGELWIAGPQTAVAIGDSVSAPKGTTMTNFASPTLELTFPSIEFVGAIRVQAAPAVKTDAGEEGIAINPLADGLTVAQIWERKDKLAGTTVKLRGRVVKFNANILGTNFLHVQDGTGDAGQGTNDLTVTSKANVRVGDVVVLEGTVVTDRDYGRGYSFPLLLDEATAVLD